VQPPNDGTVQADNEADQAVQAANDGSVQPTIDATVRANILSTTPKRLTRRYYNSFMKSIIILWLQLSITIHFSSSRLAVPLGEGSETLLNHTSPNKKATSSPKPRKKATKSPKKGIAKKLIPKKPKGEPS
jgi:hypothetical protein